MINFISKSDCSFNFGRLLTIQELIERRKESKDEALKLYGYIQVTKGKLHRVSPRIAIIYLKSDKAIEELILGPNYLRGKTPYYRTVVFTNEKKLESFLKQATNKSNYRFIKGDYSQYYTEVYD